MDEYCSLQRLLQNLKYFRVKLQLRTIMNPSVNEVRKYTPIENEYSLEIRFKFFLNRFTYE